MIAESEDQRQDAGRTDLEGNAAGSSAVHLVAHVTRLAY